jgi:hypothetical protein
MVRNPDPLMLAAGAATLFVCIWILWVGLRKTGADFGHFGQGLIGIAGSFALIAGGWLFFFQGSSHTRLELATKPTLVALPPTAEGQGRVLLQVVNHVTNLGRFPEEFECVAVDVRGLKPAAELPRNPTFEYDVTTIGIIRPNLSDQWRHCMAVERKRWGRRQESRQRQFPGAEQQPFIEPDSGHRYASFGLEAGESRTRDYELVLSCEFRAVRIHWVVPKPGNRSVNELKTVVPLDEECAKSLSLGRQRQRLPRRR